MQEIANNSGKVRVLHINSNYILTQLHQNMMTSFDSQQITHSVFSPIYFGRKGVVEPIDNVEVKECFYKWHRYLFNIKQRHIIQEAEYTFDINSFSCIHAYTLFTDGNCARALSQKYNKPYIVAIRNTDVNDFMAKRPLLKKKGLCILCDAAKILFLSRTYKELVFSKYVPEQLKKKIEKKTMIIPNGIDDFWLDNRGVAKSTPSGELKLIFAGRIDRNKNISSIQKAMEILRSEGIKTRLLVVGKIENVREYEHISRDQYTIVLPPKSMEGLLQLYRKSDIFVMPSFTESFGLVYAEALSQGIPVIYSKGQGFDNQFPDGMVGYSVDAFNPMSVANGIKRIVQNYDLIAARCPEAAMRFNWHNICKLYEKVYFELSMKNS